MKKTLIALAALAAGSAFAQSAVLSGNFTAGYTNDKAAGASTVAGLGTDTARIQLDASEDLGGGLTASAQVSLAGLNRAGTAAGENAFVQLAGGFGTLKAGAVETGAAYDLGMAQLQGGHGQDGKVLGANVTVDTVGYTAPKLGDFTLSAAYTDYNSSTKAAGAAGTTGAAGGQPAYKLAAAYASGPLSVSAAYVMYQRKDLTATDSKTKTVLGAQYDLGVAKLGVAAYSATNETNKASTATSFGVSVPMGALTLGANYTASKTGATSTTTTDKSGYVFAANYALSKTTSVNVSAYNWSTTGVSGSNTGFRVLLGKSF